MEDKKVKYKWLLFILFIVLLLSACGTSSLNVRNTVSETQLKDDLCSSTIFKEAAEKSALEVTNFNILKRQTTPEEKIDKVWVALDAETNSPDALFRVGAHLECVMIYGLYNDGWLLDEIETEDGSWVFTPLGGFTDVIAAEMAEMEGGELIENEIDLDNRVQRITYRKTVSNKYCESVYVIQDEYLFSYGAEWRWNDRKTLEKSEVWNIEGKFFYPDYRADLWLSFDGETLLWDDRVADLANGLVSTDNLSLEQYTLSHLPCRYVSEVQNGYSIEFDSVDWNDIQYATTRWHIFLIGRNHIYRWGLGQEIDHGTLTVHYYGFEELVPDNSFSSKSNFTETAYTPGTYIGTGSGWNDITVSVTVDDYNITDIRIIQHAETPGVGTRAFDPLIESILQCNSADVDTVSGATITSKGVSAAVENALAQARKP